MTGKSTIFKFFVLLFLAIIIFFNALEMKQSDRLYDRINALDDKISDGATNRSYSKSASNGDAEKDGDWLIWRLSSEPPTLNPITSKDAYAEIIAGVQNYNIFETLIRRNLDTLVYEPFLAESWKIADDGMSMEFTLKDDIWFSDGEPITTDDIEFTYNTIMDLNIDAASLRNYYIDFERCEKKDSKTIVFYMKKPYYLSFGMIGETPILPKHIYEYKNATDFNNMISNPIGSGPFMFERWDVGEQIVLKKNENYWGEKIHFDKLIYKFINNDMAALSALKSHQIDIMAPLPEQYTNNVNNEHFAKEFNTLKYMKPENSYTYISWNIKTPFFADAKVRNAMTLLVDRESIKEHIWEGLVEVLSGPFNPGSPQCNQNIKPLPFDPAKAKKLLDEAGWVDTNGNGVRDKDGVEFEFKLMIVGGSSLTEQFAKVLKNQFAKAGIIMNVDPYEWSVFLDRLHNRQFTATTLAWSGSVESDPFQIWHSSQMEGGGSNYISYNNPEVDDLIITARKTLDETKRNAYYHKFHQILHEEQPYTFMFARPSIAFMDKRIEGVEVHKLGVNLHDWYVKKENQRY